MSVIQTLLTVRKQLLLTIFVVISSLYVFWLFKIESYPREFTVPGKIDQCCCEGDLIKETNKKIRPIMRDLTVSEFFRHFRVNLENECPFWAVDLICTSKNRCGVCKCDKDEIPLPWREQEAKTNKVSSNPDRYVGVEKETSSIEPIWHALEKDNLDGVYVDLVVNPEEYTGYQGQRLWSVIYDENCFHGKDQNKCLDERILYQIVSGLHASINTQLSWFFIDHNRNDKRYVNQRLFFEKVGNHPDRMRNLYFTHSVLLRAINVAAESIKNFKYDTGKFEDDIKTENYIQHLLNQTVSSCSQPFNETEVFKNLGNEELTRQFINYFHNISQLMDCVECEKCKVYGKMQTYGIAAAMKILFNERLFGKKPVSLDRNELIALINTFNKISSSVELVDSFFVKRYENAKGFAHTIAICVLVFTTFLWVVLRAFLNSQTKMQNNLRENFKHYKQD